MEYSDLSSRKSPTSRWIALVDGCRTPFAPAGAELADLDTVQLGATAIRAVLDRAGLEASILDEVILGCAAQPTGVSNPARAAALLAGLPVSTPAVTVNRGMASGLEAITTAAERILAGRGTVYLAVGAESMTSEPLLFAEDFAAWRQELGRARGRDERLATWLKFRAAHIKGPADRIAGLSDDAGDGLLAPAIESLVSEFGISRQEQDELAFLSHRQAAAAQAFLAGEIAPLAPPPYQEFLKRDTGVEAALTIEEMAGYEPCYDAVAGTLTPGNVAPLGDGAAAILVMAEERARALGLEPLGYLRAGVTAGVEPRRHGLAGACALARLLGGTRFKLENLDLVEMNEDTAAQVIACERALASRAFAERELGLAAPVGALDPDRLNVNGGALALGHPGGATGIRLVLTLLRELRRREKEVGAVVQSLGAGQGTALLVQRP